MSNSFNKVHTEIRLNNLSKVKLSEFEELTDAIFKYLDVREIEVMRDRNNLFTTDFYYKIKNCKSLRRVKFISLEDLDAQLDVARSNLNIKQTFIDLNSIYITESGKEKVRELLSEKDDNS